MDATPSRRCGADRQDMARVRLTRWRLGSPPRANGARNFGRRISDMAFSDLESLVQQLRPSFGVIRGDPAYESLASEPRFQLVLARMGLPPRRLRLPPRHVARPR